MKKILFAAAAMILLTACPESQEHSPYDGFKNVAEMGMYAADGSAIFAFDRNRHEIGFTPETLTSRVQDDNTVTQFMCRLSGAPTSDASLILTLSGTSVEARAGSYNVRVVKKSGDYRWLWCEEGQCGFVLWWDEAAK